MNNIPDKNSIRDYITQNSKPNTLTEIVPTKAVGIGGLSIHRPEMPPRLLVYSRIYHRDTDSQIKGNLSRFVRILNSKEEPYIRKMTVGEDWTSVDTSWVKDVGYLRIQNNGGRPFNAMPTPEMIEEEASRIIDIGYKLIPIADFYEPVSYTKARTMFDPPITLKKELSITPMWMIHPNEHMEGKPHTRFPMFMRCRHGEVSVTIIAIPN